MYQGYLKKITVFSWLGVTANILCAVAIMMFTSVSLAQADDNAALNAEKAALFDKLLNAKDETEGREAEAAIWTFWFDQAPTPEAREALDAGMKRREAYDFEAAENHMNKVVELAPNYAEGYNQRAFVRFLRENYSDARDDLEKALELESEHFGAMSGLFHILRIENRRQAALSILRQAVSLHPWIKERHGLPEEMWPEHYRQLHQETI